MSPINIVKRVQERSFTLFETVVALAIMSTVVIHMAGLQGSIVFFSEYSVHSTKAMLLAKRVLSQVEYYAHRRPFSDLKYESTGEMPFEEEQTYTYTLRIRDWKLPIMDMFAAAGGGKGEEGEDSSEKSSDAGGASAMAGPIKEALGDELLKVAEVEIFWAEGAKKNSIAVSYILANLPKIDENLALVENAYKSLLTAK